jgi:HEAT repeat protein
MSNQKILFFVACSLVMLISACSRVPKSKPTATLYEKFVAIPQVTLPTDVNGLISVMLGQDVEARIQAARVLGGMGSAVEPAVPALTQNLYHFNFEARRAAAEALGKIGPGARSSVPVLIVVLLEDSFVHARVASAEALGKIGEPIAVPALATSLADESDSVQIESAISLALLSGQKFPDLDTKGGYSLNQKGVPIIVEAAKEWWETTGRYQDWLGK